MEKLLLKLLDLLDSAALTTNFFYFKLLAVFLYKHL